MKIGILAWERDEFESRDLERVAKQMGHTPVLFLLDDVTVSWDQDLQRPTILLAGEQGEEFDVILSRVYLRGDHWRADTEKLQLLSNLEGVPMVDPAAPFIGAKSKLLMMQRLSQAGLHVPPTTLCRSIEEIKCLWSIYSKIVVKPSYGYGGNDVQRITDDFLGKQEMLQELLHRYETLLVQPFLPHPQGDMRVTVVGNEIVCSFRRIPQAPAWKANVAQGASVAPYEPTEAVRQIALKAAHAMGITIAGLDIIEYEGNYVIIEVNTVPGWYFLSSCEQEEIATKMLFHALQEADQKHARKE